MENNIQNKIIRTLKAMQAQKLQDARIIEDILREIDNPVKKERKPRDWKHRELVENFKTQIRHHGNK